jgi:hypothetical protein
VRQFHAAVFTPREATNAPEARSRKISARAPYGKLVAGRARALLFARPKESFMLKETGSICFALSLTALAAACGSSTDNGNDPNTAGKGGATATAGSSALAGATAAAGSGTAGVTSNGGNATSTAGTSAGGQSAVAGSGGNIPLGGQGGTSGGNQSAAGAANGGGPASTAGLQFTGSCLYADHCTDEWDTSFGAAALEQICTGQQGTWSTGHCEAAPWKKKCTQSVFGGVYVQYLPADGICAAGFEEQL